MATIRNLPKEKDFQCSYPYKRIRIFPDRDLRASMLELVMIDTRIMQRLRNTKQLGNSNVSYPIIIHPQMRTLIHIFEMFCCFE